jgi:hypothetical protein
MFRSLKENWRELINVRFREFTSVCLLALLASVTACKSKSVSSISLSKTEEAAVTAMPAAAKSIVFASPTHEAAPNDTVLIKEEKEGTQEAEQEADDVGASDTRKAIVEQHRDFLRTQIASLDRKISSTRQMSSQASPGLAQAFNILAATERQFRDAYARELKQVEEALDNWKSWGKNTVFPWEVSQPNHSHSFYSNFSNPSSGASSRQCRSCGVCSGRGQIGPFGNAYSGAGYRPAQTCSNCGGSGTVCY